LFTDSIVSGYGYYTLPTASPVRIPAINVAIGMNIRRVVGCFLAKHSMVRIPNVPAPTTVTMNAFLSGEKVWETTKTTDPTATENKMSSTLMWQLSDIVVLVLRRVVCCLK